MAAPLTFETPLLVAISEGREHEFALTVEYNFERGYPDTYDEPGCPACIEIVGLRLSSKDGKREFDIPAWMEQVILGDDCLAESILAEAKEEAAESRHYAAELRAEIAREYAGVAA